MAIKKSDLYSSLWASCDELRGGMDATQYKDYVLFMLFIKYVSDKYADSDDFAPPITIPPGSSFKEMVALTGKPDIGDKINTQIIQPLIDANSRLARSDFPDFNDPNKLGEGQAMVDRLSKLIGIFQKPELDFSNNRAENDDILGDAYEYLMRHFASQSGKSKGQFYTPSEVSRIMAKVLGVSSSNTVASTTAYDPTCGSGSLLLKVAAEAGKHITLEGQEMDVTTAGLARMNMILHDFPTANILQGNTISNPKFKDGEALRTYDYIVANPPFSDKAWSTGLTPSTDQYQRFAWGEPPKKQGDYAYLLHIIRSMKSNGKAACILPHGVLFRGNAEAVIREKLVRSGILKGVIGLPANLFYGTGIPACILVLDKENAEARKGIFMIDASKGFIKDGSKNRLREQDLHKIVDAFNKFTEIPRYSRMVPLSEISDAKNDFNLNLPRYIDSSEPEDIQDIDAHLNGGIPERDIDALSSYWDVLPAVRATLFESTGRSGYVKLKLPIVDVKHAILSHSQFVAFNESALNIFEGWKQNNLPVLKSFNKNGHPKQLIEALSEDLLARFRLTPLVNAYDVYQHLMDYWSETMQDDCYLIADLGWRNGAQPREVLKVKGENGKLTWPKESFDYEIGKRRFKSDLVPAALLEAKFFESESKLICSLESELLAIEQKLQEMMDENSGDDGLLIEVIEGEGDKQKISAKAVKARVKEIKKDIDYADELQVLQGYSTLLDEQAKIKSDLKVAQDDLTEKLAAKYPQLTEDEVKFLVINGKWIRALRISVEGELDRVSQTLTYRISQLAERYATPLSLLNEQLLAVSKRVVDYLKQAATEKLLTGEIRLPGFNEPWRTVSLGELSKMGSGGTPLSSVSSYYGGDIPWVSISDMTNAGKIISTTSKTLTKNGLANSSAQIFPAGTVLYAMYASLGECSIAGIPLCTSQAILGIQPNDELDNEFLYYYLTSLKPVVKTMGQQGTQSNLNKGMVQSFLINLPPISEQVAIAKILADIDLEHSLLKARSDKTSDLKQAMMQGLLIGNTGGVK